MTLSNPTRLFSLTVLTLGLAAGGCDSKPADELAADWKKAGIEVGPVEAMEEHAFGKAECSATRAGGLKTTLCAFEDEKAAEAARQVALASVGDHTGAALIHGAQLLVVADIEDKDPEGRTIQTLTKTFMGKK